MTNNSNIDFEAFCIHLATTIVWCRPRFSIDRPAESLRSSPLEPSLEITATDDLPTIDCAVADVIGRRKAIVGVVDLTAVKFDGRLFGFLPRHTLSDGVSAMETGGFIDETNTPPWDSWVYMFGELLITWVPPEMVDGVHGAIMCNAEECIAWLSDLDHPLANKLKEQHVPF